MIQSEEESNGAPRRRLLQGKAVLADTEPQLPKTIKKKQKKARKKKLVLEEPLVDDPIAEVEKGGARNINKAVKIGEGPISTNDVQIVEEAVVKTKKKKKKKKTVVEQKNVSVENNLSLETPESGENNELDEISDEVENPILEEEFGSVEEEEEADDEKADTNPLVEGDTVENKPNLKVVSESFNFKDEVIVIDETKFAPFNESDSKIYKAEPFFPNDSLSSLKDLRLQHSGQQDHDQAYLEHHPWLATVNPTLPFYQLPYGITLFLILLVHVVSFVHWNKRITKRDVAVSYDTLVTKKHFHKAIVALLSHPPVSDSSSSSFTNSNGNQGTFGALMGSDDFDGSSGSSRGNRLMVFTRRIYSCGPRQLQRFLARIMKPMLTYFQPLISGHLSGLPLMVYNSHVLWTCRALEEMWSASPYSYGRMLIVLVLTALSLDLFVTHRLLQTTRTLVGMSSPGSSSTHPHRILKDRSICSLTPLVTALLMIYQEHFRNIPMDVLPFLTIPANYISAETSYILTFFVLAVLSHRTYPILGVVYGTIAGQMWNGGLTRFLAQAYWGNILYVIVAVMCAVSIRSTSTRNSRGSGRRVVGSTTLGLVDFIPFLEYVAWDEKGSIRRHGQYGSNDSHRDDEDSDNDHNDEEGRQTENSSDHDPLASWERRPDSDVGIRGRVPLMALDSEGDTEVSDSNLGGGNGMWRRSSTNIGADSGTSAHSNSSGLSSSR
eukprot:CAMPEP_0198284000 /NCGR_PEP_ID=MMETSP1449-20131203/3555_1 /TAXON_ID=420275 /ORGANISM="Attheya septentrionalis, Strain CCMP2084" /LENGTH=720 /DNA_ID=CAMNT_0043980905 /DNA_START=252 /DNA_END=2414 /DNA_ORIENTATION=+